MTALTSPWALACLATYAVLLVIALAANHGAHRKPDPEPEFVRRASYPPPVPAPITPPLSQAVPSADWFFDIPAECLGDDAVRALCDDIERREFSDRTWSE